MNADFKKSFLRNTKKIIGDIPNLKKLKGHKKGIYYRIAVGNYRIGVTIDGDLVTFVTCMPRKDIYKFFP